MSELSPIFVMFGHRPEHPGGNMAYLLTWILWLNRRMTGKRKVPENDRGEKKRSGHDGEKDA